MNQGARYSAVFLLGFSTEPRVLTYPKLSFVALKGGLGWSQLCLSIIPHGLWYTSNEYC